MNTLITIFADASLKNEKGGYGFWFKSKYTQGKGKGCEPANSIEHAELLGICRCIKEAWSRHKKVLDQKEVTLVIQCDNTSALGMLLTHGKAKVAKNSTAIELRKKWSPEELALVEEVRTHLPDTEIYLKHVKGHTKGKDARSHINRITDKLSKEASGSNGGRGSKGQQQSKQPKRRNRKVLYRKVTGPKATGL